MSLQTHRKSVDGPYGVQPVSLLRVFLWSLPHSCYLSCAVADASTVFTSPSREYGYMMKITEKSDVYSYGVVMLEVLTGKQPIYPTIPDGLHVVELVRQRKGVEVLDQSLLSRAESEIEEMMQALGIVLLCVNSSPDERPTMRDVAAMLKEIIHEREEYAKVDVLLKGSPANDFQGSRSSNNGVLAASSSFPVKQSLYPESNNTTFSVSSLLHSSSTSAKLGFK